MQLKRDNTPEDNSNQQSSAPQNDYYNTQASYEQAGQAGQSPYGGPSQSPYGGPSQSPYGGPSQSPYGGPSQSPYGGPSQSPYGQPSQSPYGAPNQSQYGQPNAPYGQPNDPYGQPSGFGQPAQSAYREPIVSQKKSIPGWVIGILALAVVGIFAYMFLCTDIFGKRFKPGKVSGSKFKNEYFGVEIESGVDSTMMGYTGSESDEKKELETKYRPVNEMILTTNKGEVLIFSVLYTGQDIKGSGYTDSEIMNQMEGAFKSTIESSGYEGATVEKDSMSIGGRSRQGFTIKASTGYGTAYCCQYYVFSGKYVGFFTSVAYSKSRASSIITDHVKKCDPD